MTSPPDRGSKKGISRMTRFKVLPAVALAAIVTLLAPVAIASCTGADPNWSSSPDQSSVSTCVSKAANGSTINVSAGNASWSSRVSISGKALNIIGAGAGQTVLSSAGFTLTNSASRISGFTFNWSSNNYTFVIEGSVGFRIDHNTIVYPSASDMLLSYGQGGRPVEGLVDHNDITYGRTIYYGDNNSETTGNNRWAEPLNWGTSHYLYVEDNKISWPHGSSGGYLNSFDGNYGCRYVLRFNTILNGRAEAHSLQGDNSRGCRAWEMYNNNWTNNSDPSYRQWFVRGGTGLIFHETSDGKAMNNSINIDNARSFEVSIENQLPRFGMCGAVGTNPQPDGSSWIDKNDPDQYGHRCRDQIGASTDASQWANNFPNPAPAQAFQPAYFWRNTQPSGEIPIGINCDNSGIPCNIQSTYHIVESRDYYTYRSNFNGSAGVGEGTLANRPSSCTVGVGYWATDQGEWNANHAGADGELFTCTAPNTWTLTYIPYTYPHPLQGGGGGDGQPEPPTGMEADVK
jgi:hypothetical protein